MIGPIEELFKQEEHVTDCTIDGHCSNCGGCCSDYLPLSRHEIDRIHKFMKKHNLKEHVAKIMSGPYVDGTCPFRDNVKRKCDIYEVRPEICRCFRCDQDMSLIEANKARLYKTNSVISMRGVFFKDEFGNFVASTIFAASRK